MAVQMTRHSVKRGRERIGIPKASCERNAQKALDLGVTHGETRGGLNRYLTSIYFNNERVNNIRVYNRFVYLFSGSKLVTVMALPKKYHDAADKLQKKKENDNGQAGEPTCPDQ